MTQRLAHAAYWVAKELVLLIQEMGDDDPVTGAPVPPISDADYMWLREALDGLDFDDGTGASDG